MAVKGNSSSERTTRWDVLLTNLRADLPNMPHLADDFNALEAQLLQARALETHREDLRSQVRAAMDQQQKVLSEGDKQRARIGATLKGKFGFTDAALVKYGFTPLPKIRKRKSTPPPPPVEAKAPPVTTAVGINPVPPAPVTAPAAAPK